MNGRKALQVARYEYRVHVRRGGFLLATFGLPALSLLILIVIQTATGRAAFRTLVVGDLSRPIAVVDQARALPETLPSPFTYAPDIDQGRTGVREGRYGALVVIPPDYPEARRVVVYVTSSPTFGLQVHDAVKFLMAYAELRNRYTPLEVQRLIQGPEAEVVLLGVSPEREHEGRGRPFVGIALSVLFYFALFPSAGYLLQSVAQEKESRIMEILLSSLTPMELLWGKVLGLGALGLTQVAVWLLFARMALERLDPAHAFLRAVSEMLRRPDPQLMVAGLVIVPLGYLSYALLMAGFGSLGNNLRESQQFAAATSTLAALPFMLNMFFVINPSGPIPRALSYFPLTAPTAALLRLALGALPWWELGLITLIVLLGALGSVWVGVRLFRVGVLLYGKKPSWHEVWHIVRHPV